MFNAIQNDNRKDSIRVSSHQVSSTLATSRVILQMSFNLLITTHKSKTTLGECKNKSLQIRLFFIYILAFQAPFSSVILKNVYNNKVMETQLLIPPVLICSLPVPRLQE